MPAGIPRCWTGNPLEPGNRDNLKARVFLKHHPCPEERWVLLQKASVFQPRGCAGFREEYVSSSPFKMDPVLHIVCSARKWEVTLRLFLTKSSSFLFTPSDWLKHTKSPLPVTCPNHWAEDSALLGSKPEYFLPDFSRIRGESPIQSPVVKVPPWRWETWIWTDEYTSSDSFHKHTNYQTVIWEAEGVTTIKAVTQPGF